MSSWTARAAGAGGSHVAPGCHDQCAGVPLGEQARAGKQVREERAGMCGITGWVDYRRDLTEERDIIAAMSATMECRGPDAGGIWCAPHAAIGHRRLSVIDIEGGIQPMLAGRDPDVVLTFSGEIYNFRELRRELASYGHAFRTRSDTEVLLRAWLQWGARCVSRLNGMFAFAVWDAESQELVLVSDRMGIKPLYYARLPDGAVFGSEPKAILAHPQVAAELDAEGIAELFAQFGARTPGHGVYRGLAEVRPGWLVRVTRAGAHAVPYWQLTARPHTDNLHTTVAAVRDLLEDIVERQLVADVPLCTLLSGGLASSTLTAMAAGSVRRHGGSTPSWRCRGSQPTRCSAGTCGTTTRPCWPRRPTRGRRAAPGRRCSGRRSPPAPGWTSTPPTVTPTPASRCPGWIAKATARPASARFSTTG